LNSPNEPGVPQRIFQYNNTDNAIYSARALRIRPAADRVPHDITYSGFRRPASTCSNGRQPTSSLRVFKGNDETPRFYYRDSSGGTSYAFRSPYQLIYGTGNAALDKSNNQIGAYLQDDWSPTSRLTINLGVRWDFESRMMNYDYVTPQDVIDTLTRYNDSLPTPLDLSRYISTGNSRKPFGRQPRLGFSYSLDQDNKTTIFGGFASITTAHCSHPVDETLKLTHPTFTIQFAPDSAGRGPGRLADSCLTADKAT
jgi:outer membrane receptor protein involved in Fe transport